MDRQAYCSILQRALETLITSLSRQSLTFENTERRTSYYDQIEQYRKLIQTLGGEAQPVFSPPSVQDIQEALETNAGWLAEAERSLTNALERPNTHEIDKVRELVLEREYLLACERVLPFL